MYCVVGGNLRELRYGNRARRARLRENHFRSEREEHPGDLVHSFIAQRPKHQPDLAPRKVLFQKSSELARRRRIVRAI